MCPEPQILSIYVDKELPSPWKEKMEKHLKDCPVCKEKLNNLRQLKELFKKTNSQNRTIVEKEGHERVLAEVMNEQEFIDSSREKVWRKLEAKRRYCRNYSLIKHKFSIPLSAAAIIAVIAAVFMVFWVHNEQGLPNEINNFILAAEEEIPVLPADMDEVLQFLNLDNTEMLIMRLPETSNFSRTGDPVIVTTANNRRRHP